MNTPSFKENHISQIPALQLLQKMGYRYLSPAEAMAMRNNKETQVLLEGVLKNQLRKINSIRYKKQEYAYSEGNLNAGIQALKELPLQEGYINASEYIYNLLTLGLSLEQSIEGDKKSFTLQYIDWENPENNVFHVTDEYSVMRAASKERYRPDVVLFINGIPIGIIECKRPDMKAPIEQAISQHLRNQQEDGIRQLYVYSQLLMSLATNQARYATNATPPKFWAHWEEKFERASQEKAYELNLSELKNKPLNADQKSALFSGEYQYLRNYFDQQEAEERQATEQDEYLYSLCRPERLLDIIFNFIVFDAGEKKIARYQQYFAVKKAMNRVRTVKDGKRIGGVVWHTQGSGKSLTMVMLAQAIAMDKSIRNPKIILVTDRIDLDTQITETFRKCNQPVLNANTGKQLVELLKNKSDAVITTVINKFEAAVRKVKEPFESPDIFVLIDEGHRTQYGTFNVKMQLTLPNACFIAFTGTPLQKKEKDTAHKFGGIIDAYTVNKAVEDKAVVPLLYEGRHAFQKVHDSPVDTYFSMISEPLTNYQKADLKRKFSQKDHLNAAEQKMYAIAWDISLHYKNNWQGLPERFKGQLVCDRKLNAIRYKEMLDDIGIVSTELVMSPPDEREGEETAYGETNDKVKRFWKTMMDEHGNSKEYETNIKSRFKFQTHPEIVIVVDKWLTGFDAPNNTVLYLTRSLKEHTLLQAIARVNRVYPGKDFGYVIDYYGVLAELDEALEKYSSFEDFASEDLEGTLTNVKEEIKTLPQKHSELWDIFKTIENRKDIEAYERLLADEAIRSNFYDKLSAFSRTLKIALSSITFNKEVSEAEIDKYKEDAGFFLKLRKSVKERYSDEVDYKHYEAQIQKLIDKHIETDKVEPITELVNIFDKEKFDKEVENIMGTTAKADRIASRTQKHINEKMDEDPAFYKKFSSLLEETIEAYRQQRITEAEYLSKSKEIMEAVLSHTDDELPEELKGRDNAIAIFGLSIEALGEKTKDKTISTSISKEVALSVEEIIRDIVFDHDQPKVDWWLKSNILNKLKMEIGDYLIDEVRDKYQIKLSFEEMDGLTNNIIDIAKIRYKG